METYNKYFCQKCGGNTKMVETLIGDKFVIDEDGTGQFNGFSDDFDHTGREYCADCEADWTGADLPDELEELLS